MSRQNYYKQRRYRRRRAVDEGLILSLVRRERALQPRLGTRKLLHILGGELKSAGVSVGRDKFFSILSRSSLLIERRLRGHRTTDSRHGFRVYGNLLKDIVLTSAHQALVSDITYIRTDEGFMYLSLVMDAYSRAVVGYYCSDNLEGEGTLRSLSMALRGLPADSKTIHHSDRGSQYCNHAYVNKLQRKGVRVSMTEENHCYENAVAERVNGILKDEFYLDQCFVNMSKAKLATKSAIEIYNDKRLHLSLGLKTPNMVFNNVA